MISQATVKSEMGPFGFSNSYCAIVSFFDFLLYVFHQTSITAGISIVEIALFGKIQVRHKKKFLTKIRYSDYYKISQKMKFKDKHRNHNYSITYFDYADPEYKL